MYRDSMKRCYDCDDHAAKMDSARDYFEGVLNELFSMDKLNEELLEHNLENLCFVLGLKVPETCLQVVRKEQPKHILHDWIKWNNEYLKSTARAV